MHLCVCVCVCVERERKGRRKNKFRHDEHMEENKHSGKKDKVQDLHMNFTEMEKGRNH